MARNPFFRLGSALILAASCFNPMLSAQTETANISGVVTDASGAAVLKAAVVLESAERGTKMETATNDSGFYAFSGVLPGRYQLTVRKAGFKQIDLRGVIVNVQDNMQQNFSLEVGSVSDSVMVEGRSETVNTQSASVSTVVDRQFAENLPLNGRSFQTLIMLAPGVALSPGNNNKGEFSVNGSRASANSFIVDGVSANIGADASGSGGNRTDGNLPAFSLSGTTQSLVSIDAMQEFRIDTSTYAAEYGRQPGGQVIIVTRSGTNALHGTAFEYFRNNDLDANGWFADASGQRKPPERQNDFGGVLGGPVYIPHVYNGRNRTFFFFSYEGLRLRLPQYALTNVPTLAFRQQAPSFMQPYLNAFPLPNGRDLGNGLAELNSTYSDPSGINATSIRIDHTVNNRLTLFGRFNDAPSESYQKRPDETLSIDQYRRFNMRTATIGATATITPRLINEARFNYSYNGSFFDSPLDTFGGAAPATTATLLPSAYDNVTNQLSWKLNFTGLTQPAAPYLFISGHQISDQHQINAVEHLSYVTGAHQLKVGFDYRHLTPIDNTNPPYQLITTFSNEQQVINGVAPSGTVTAYVPQYPVFLNFSAFADDTWKVSRNLTVTLGLRWDVNPPPTEKTGKDALAVTETTNLETMQLAPRGTPEWHTPYKNFAPRLGMAYRLFRRPGRETVLRAGGGVFFDTGNDESSQPLAGSYPYTSSYVLSNVVFPLNPTQVAPLPLPYLAGITPPYPLLYAFDPHLKLPYTWQWNLALEQSLGAGQSLTVSYVGSAGRSLMQDDQISIGQINPNFTTINLTRNLGSSDYDSLQAQFQRRLSKGLQMLVSYTWSHALDNDSASSTLRLPQRGNALFDIRQVLGAAVTYDFRGPSGNRLQRGILSGWSLDSSFHTQTALPVDLVASTLVNPLDGSLVNVRPNVVPGTPLYLSDPHAAGGRKIDAAAFSIPPAGQSGNLGRNQLRALGAWQLDSALRRQFSLSEQLKLQFRFEAFNLFNHPNFGAIQTSLTAANFGQATATLGAQYSGLNALYQIGGARSIQLALKLSF
ncbi:MAG TPA: carboxypeptidase regulatory-like domain-containing protein [Bryobacteraceae bacterium]|nr:carboxypeptidase regulatory-like domain-containing protein [Bryobacteraceae bacterium]